MNWFGMGVKETIKRVWHFLWDEDSIWSWIANVVLAFVIIKFLLYPGLGWVLGTPAPIVAVVSGSMEHDGSFDDWWAVPSCCNDFCSKKEVQGLFYAQFDIDRADFRSFDFVNGFNMGDIMILYSAKNAELGDVIVFMVPNRADPIIHRVIQITEENGQRYFTTKGDHNCDIGAFEQKMPAENVIGKAVWRVPWLGWVKIIAVWIFDVLRGAI